jgi:hypothetical protein
MKDLLFIIFLHIGDVNKMTGGLLVCHELAYEIAKRGYKVMIFCDPLKNHENIIVNKSIELIHSNGERKYTWNSFTYDINKTITIYPEIFFGNPIGTKHVVRWLLNKPFQEYPKTDDIFYFKDHNYLNLENKKELTIIHRNLDKLYDNHTVKKNGYCHILHKNTPKDETVLKNLDSFDLSEWRKLGGIDYFRETINNYKYFLTYDDKTYYTIMASLCGTIPIIIPIEGKTPDDFRNENEQQRLGIAYGFDDIDWAIKTMSLVRENQIDSYKHESNTIDRFIEYFEKKIISNN